MCLEIINLLKQLYDEVFDETDLIKLKKIKFNLFARRKLKKIIKLKKIEQKKKLN